MIAGLNMYMDIFKNNRATKKTNLSYIEARRLKNMEQQKKEAYEEKLKNIKTFKKMIKLKAKPGIPRIKADGTATIPLNTLVEMDKKIFDFLASANLDKRSLVITISTETLKKVSTGLLLRKDLLIQT